MKYIYIIVILVLSIFIFIACTKEKLDSYAIEPMKKDDIAIMTLFVSDGRNDKYFGLLNLGHSFLKIKNVSNDSIKIYGYELLSDEELTISTWPISSHFGIWFNLESKYINKYNKYSDRVSISVGINQKDINKINNKFYIIDKWNPLFNCTSFSLAIYNEIASSNEIINLNSFKTPKSLYEEIMKFNEHLYQEDVILNQISGYFNDDEFLSFDLVN